MCECVDGGKGEKQEDSSRIVVFIHVYLWVRREEEDMV